MLPASAGPGGRTRVLVVEDKASDARLIREALRDEFEILEASSLAEALSSGPKAAPDVILLDLNLPDARGIESLAKLRTVVPQASAVVMAGLDDEALARQALKAGAQDYLVKGEAGFLALGRSIRYALERKRAEQVLRSSSEQYRMLFDSNPSPMWVFDARTLRILAVNGEAILEYGYSRDEFLALTVADLRPPEEIDSLRAQLERQPRESAAQHVGRWRHRKKNGDIFEVEVTASPIQFDERPSWLVLARDLTDVDRAERELREREERYRHLFNAVADAIVIIDPETDRVLDANRVASLMYGYAREDFLQLRKSDLSSDPEASLSSLKILARGDRRIIVLRHQRRRDGSSFPAEIHLSTFQADGRRLVVGVIRDLTERIKDSEKLAESEQRFRQMAENITQVFWMTDPQKHEMVYISPAYEAIWGRSCDDLYRRPASWMEAIVPEDAALVRSAARDQASGGYDVTYRIRRPDGQTRWIRDRAFPIRDGDRVIRVTGVAEDVTAQREQQLRLQETETQLRQAQKMEAVGRLAGGVAHDFNNLLTAILGLAEFSINALPEDHPVRADLVELRRTGHRAAALTQQLLAFSRRQIITPRPMDLNDTVLGLAKMLRRVIGENIELSVVPGPISPVIRADPGQIEQLIVNLAVNARDAMADGGKLKIETGIVDLDEAAAAQREGLCSGAYAVLSVADTGTGMTDEVKSHLYEPFFTTKGLGKGTGLGLATCYGIVKQNGGAIVCESELGRGTTFRIFLSRLSGSEADLRSEQETRGGRLTGTETVLLAEDDEAVRRLVSRHLSLRGYHVIEAQDGEAALTAVRADTEKAIALLITDMVMPKFGGRLLAEMIGGVRPELKILFTSGYTDDMIGGTFGDEQADRFLRKPFSGEELAEKVRQVLDAGR